MERDIILIAVGGLIGMMSSLLTLLAVYIFEGLRLRRQWEREDRLLVQQKRTELQDMLAAGREQQTGAQAAADHSREAP